MTCFMIQVELSGGIYCHWEHHISILEIYMEGSIHDKRYLEKLFDTFPVSGHVYDDI